MKDHVIDPKSGFLTPGPAFVGTSLNSAQKVMFLKTYLECFNLTKAAKVVQTTRLLVTQHMEQDKAFGEAVQAVVDEVIDEVEESIYKQSKRSPIAAMQLLKAKRGKEWGNNKKVTENVTDKTSDKLKALLNES